MRRPIGNGVGADTRLSGAPLHPEVAEAMRAASETCADVLDTQAPASRESAVATGAEAGIATSGTAAALLLGAAAIVSGLDAARMDRVPRLEAGFLVARSRRNRHGRAVETAGVRRVEVGVPDRFSGAGGRDPQPGEFAAAIGPRTHGILWVAQPWIEPPLPALVRVARAHGRPIRVDAAAQLRGVARRAAPARLPILVDAAAQLPPAANLRLFREEGADLVCFSGGRAIGGPQASGILAGRRDRVTAALVQALDLDRRFEDFHPPGEFSPARGLACRPPHGIGRHGQRRVRDGRRLACRPPHGIGRPCKVGREAVAGLLAALRRFLAEGVAAREARWRAALERLPGETLAVGAVPMRATPGDAAPEARPRGPGIHLSTARLGEGVLLVNAIALREGDAARIAEVSGVFRLGNGNGAGFSGGRVDAPVPVLRDLIAQGGPAAMFFETLTAEVLLERLRLRGLAVTRARADIAGLGAVHDSGGGALWRAAESGPDEPRVRLAAEAHARRRGPGGAGGLGDALRGCGGHRRGAVAGQPAHPNPEYAPGCPAADRLRGSGRAADFVAEDSTKLASAR